MKIISKHQDYYDSALAYGVDETNIFKRDKQLVCVSNSNLENLIEEIDPVLSKKRHFNINREFSICCNELYSFNLHFLAFCGKLIPFVSIAQKLLWRHERDAVRLNSRHVAFSLDEITHFISKQAEMASSGLKKKIERLCTKLPKSKTRLSAYSEKSFGLSDFFELSKLQVNADIFDQVSSPYFLFTPSLIKITEGQIMDSYTFSPSTLGSNSHKTAASKELIEVITKSAQKEFTGRIVEINPSLKELGFFRQVNAYEAFSQIEQFRSGVMTNNPTAPQITDDKVKRESHGFTDQSFKKRKAK